MPRRTLCPLLTPQVLAALMLAAGVLAAAPARAKEACPPRWAWELREPNYSCRIVAAGQTATEAEARQALQLHDDLGRAGYANCTVPVTAPAGSATVTAEGAGYRWQVDRGYLCQVVR